MDKTQIFNAWLIKQVGMTPPRPGLMFDRQKHRWVRPVQAGKHDIKDIFNRTKDNKSLGRSIRPYVTGKDEWGQITGFDSIEDLKEKERKPHMPKNAKYSNIMGKILDTLTPEEKEAGTKHYGDKNKLAEAMYNKWVSSEKTSTKIPKSLASVGEYINDKLNVSDLDFNRGDKKTRKFVRKIAEEKYGKSKIDKYTDEQLENSWFVHEPQ